MRFIRKPLNVFQMKIKKDISRTAMGPTVHRINCPTDTNFINNVVHNANVFINKTAW